MDVGAPADAHAEGGEAEAEDGECGVTFVAEADELHALVAGFQATVGAPNAGAYARVIAIVRGRWPGACVPASLAARLALCARPPG